MGRPATTRITSPYGYSSGYVGFHNGIDFAHSDPSNTPVYAFRAGTVTFVGVSSAWSGRGRVVVIDHGNGVVSWSCHLSGTWVSAGQHVSEGDRVGTMGATGAVLGIHLHWMIYLNGAVVDPTPYLTSSSGGGTTPFTPAQEEVEMILVYVPSNRAWMLINPVSKTFWQTGDQGVANMWARLFGNARTVLAEDIPTLILVTGAKAA